MNYFLFHSMMANSNPRQIRHELEVRDNNVKIAISENGYTYTNISDDSENRKKGFLVVGSYITSDGLIYPIAYQIGGEVVMNGWRLYTSGYYADLPNLGHNLNDNYFFVGPDQCHFCIGHNAMSSGYRYSTEIQGLPELPCINDITGKNSYETTVAALTDLYFYYNGVI